MPRPPYHRIVQEPPLYSEFKPAGLREKDLKTIVLTLDEYEAIRLADQLGLTHAMAADEMEISRSTFTRLIERARKKMADFIIQGGQLTIEGGAVHFRVNMIRCRDCNHLFNTGFTQDVSECPACHSGKLVNLAGNYGHGKCCILPKMMEGEDINS